ncbi:hypothetical protein AAC387_Pa03g3808 [Persea americana]
MSFSSSSSTAATTKSRSRDGSGSRLLPLPMGRRPHLPRPHLETHRRHPRHRREAPHHHPRPLLQQSAKLHWHRRRRPAFKLHECSHSMRKPEIKPVTPLGSDPLFSG